MFFSKNKTIQTIKSDKQVEELLKDPVKYQRAKDQLTALYQASDEFALAKQKVEGSIYTASSELSLRQISTITGFSHEKIRAIIKQSSTNLSPAQVRWADSYQGPKIVTIVSARGGIGKSTTAVNLAAHAQRALEGRGILLVDMDDMYGEDQPVENHTVDGVQMNLKKMAASFGEPEKLSARLEALKSDYDLIVIDTASPYSALYKIIQEVSDKVLVLTTPEEHAIAANCKLMKFAPVDNVHAVIMSADKDWGVDIDSVTGAIRGTSKIQKESVIRFNDYHKETVKANNRRGLLTGRNKGYTEEIQKLADILL
jgi:Mrp family chromosome partitioning ATPase